MEINLLAVLVAAIASFAIGALWYGPVFGRVWMGMMGFTHDSIRSMPMTPAKAMTIGAIVQLVTAYVLAHFVVALNVSGAAGALELAGWIWLGFIATGAIGAYLWEGKPFKLFLFNAAHALVALSVASLILTFWR
jgi:hypothetical protein